MNVLLTSAGRRNYLINYFRDALQGSGHVFAADASADAPALQEADKAFVVPLASDSEYIDKIVHVCRQNEVGLLVSLNDLELPVIAKNRQLFLSNGTIPVISSPETINTCFDKWATHNFLQSIGVSSPKTYLSLHDARNALISGALSFPVVVKPRWGTSSIGIEFAHDLEELELAYRVSSLRLKRSFLAAVSSSAPEHYLLIQEYLEGDEYGLDIINDINGNYVTTVVKRKLVMRAGETDRAITIVNDNLNVIGEIVGKHLGHVGNLDCDVFVNTSGINFLEMNPRFGGGYPFSHIAGLNLPAALISWARCEATSPEWFTIETNVASAKCDGIVRIKLTN
jgi:carbamoyl-phosphate synthase large subunit